MAQDFDVAFKLLFEKRPGQVVRSLAGARVARWLSGELPGVRNQRADMIGETEDGDIVHIEFQTANAEDLPVRMAQYYAAIYRKFKRYPRQILFYAGREKLRIPERFSSPAMQHRYRVIDIGKLNGERYLASPEVGDQILAVLMRLRDRPAAIRQVLESICGLKPDDAVEALDLLLVISGLRALEVQIEEEMHRMPVLISRLENKVLGREFKKGLQQGREKGIKEGLQQGLEQGLEQGLNRGEASMFRRMLVARFERIPKWAEVRLGSATREELDQWAGRFTQAKKIRDVFGSE